MKKIADYISVPDVETVVQVSSVSGLEEADLKRRFVDSFVITDDIMNGIVMALSSACRHTGTGFILKGNYGSGKSHFMAFLASLLIYPRLLEKFLSERPALNGYIESLNERPVLPVYLTLTDYPSQSGLSDIVIEALSAALRSHGLNDPLSDSTRLVDDFRRIMLPGLGREFGAYLSSKNIDGFDSLDHRMQTETVLGFLFESKIPFRPLYDYQEYFDSADRLVGELYSGGVFFLVDELSEFLRARSSGDRVSEDIRFLQFMGERAGKTNMRVLFAMQESIEEAADVSADGLGRIKDRYPVRINLTALHLRKLVEMRLLEKRRGAAAGIDAVYAALSDSFPGWNAGREDFRAIYPVHPATFELLEGVAGIFSKTRGMVDFIVSEIKGDNARGIPGMLDEPADRLLYPDRVFDRFRDNLQESIEHNRLVSAVYAAIERSASSFFKNEKDVSVALRVVKLIILFHILPEKKRLSARDLAHLVFENRFAVDPDFNYTFMRDRILKTLEREWPFLGTEKSALPLDDRFYIQYEENPFAQFNSRVRQFEQKNSDITKQAIWHFISSMTDPELPLADYRTGERELTVHFENTRRKGIGILKALSAFSADETSALSAKLSRGDHDFALFIGFPADDANELECLKTISAAVPAPLCDAFFFWKPRAPLERETTLLCENYARSIVYDRLDEQKRDKSVSELVDESKKNASRCIKDLYSAGSLFYFENGQRMKGELLFTGSFDKTVELFARDALKRIYPWHAKIMPSAEIGSGEILSQIVMLFREKSEIDFTFEGNRVVKNALDALLKSSSLLKITQNQYKISPEPSKNPFLKDLLAEIERSPSSFEDLYLKFRKGRYGIIKDLFSLYVFFLACSGFITLKKTGRAQKPASLDLRLVQSCDTVCSGEEFSALFVERYAMLEPFSSGINSKNVNLLTQTHVWDKLVEYRRTEESRIEGLKRRHEELSAYPIFKNNPIPQIGEAIERVIFFISRIKTSKQPKDGIESLLCDIENQPLISADIETMTRFGQFLQNDLDQMVFIYNYIVSPELNCYSDELKNSVMRLLGYFRDMDALIASGRSGIVSGHFNSFRDEYKKAYSSAHRALQSAESISSFENIRLSPAYRALANLSRIRAISVPDDFARVEGMLRSAAVSVCRRQVLRELDMKPYCDCRLKREDLGFSPDDVRSVVHRGISEYIEAITSADNMARIMNYMGALQSSGETDRRDMIKAVLGLVPADTAEIDIQRILSLDAVLLIDEALSSNIRIIEKNIVDFVSLVAGRRFKRDDLMRELALWLDSDSSIDGETMYLVHGPGPGDGRPSLPPMLLDVLKRAMPGVDETVRIRVFALSLFLLPIDDGRYMNIIREVLHYDADRDVVVKIIDENRDFVSEIIDWEDFFEHGMINEVVDALIIGDKTISGLADIFNAAQGFPSVREAVIKRLLAEDVQIGRDAGSFFEIDGTHHSTLIESVLGLKTETRRFYRESGKSEFFNPVFFITAFKCMMHAENARWISINNNIMPEILVETVEKARNDIEESAASCFNSNIASWEKIESIAVRSIIPSIKSDRPLVIVFDSLRTDLYLNIIPVLERAGLKSPSLDLYISPMPSDTLSFRSELFNGIELSSGTKFEFKGHRWVFQSAVERDYKFGDLRELISTESREGIVVSVNLFDEKIHSTKQSVASLSGEINLFFEQTLIPLLLTVPNDREIIIMNDHGFAERGRYSRPDEARYSHGGNSYLERIVFTARIKRD